MHFSQGTIRDKLLFPLLITIVAIPIGRGLVYLLRFFGIYIQESIMKSMSLQQNVKVYTNILLTLILCLLSLIAFVIFLLIRIKEKNVITPKEPKNKRDLSKNALKILAFFGHESNIEFTNEELRKYFDLSFNKLQVAIDELTEVDFLYIETPYGEESVYELSEKGRGFLERNDLL